MKIVSGNQETPWFWYSLQMDWESYQGTHADLQTRNNRWKVQEVKWTEDRKKQITKIPAQAQRRPHKKTSKYYWRFFSENVVTSQDCHRGSQDMDRVPKGTHMGLKSCSQEQTNWFPALNKLNKLLNPSTYYTIDSFLPSTVPNHSLIVSICFCCVSILAFCNCVHS